MEAHTPVDCSVENLVVPGVFSRASSQDIERLLDLADATIPSRALHVAAELGVADRFGRQPRALGDLAAETSTDPVALCALLRLLAGHGIVSETAEGDFVLAPRGKLLRSDHPQSLRSIVRLYGFVFDTFTRLGHSLSTGEPAFPPYHGGQSLFEFLRANQEQGAMFNDAMADLSRIESTEIVSGYDFSPYRRIVDVGGGTGTLLASILAICPEAAGILFDRPHVVDKAENTREEYGLGLRMQVVPGDFFEEVFAGGDLYLLKSVIHDWPDDRATDILRRCREAIGQHGRLVLFERMLVPGDSPSQAKSWNLMFLLLLGGRVRTREDFERLLADSGFVLSRVVPLGPIFAVEALPAGRS